MELQKKFNKRGFLILEDLLSSEECEFYKDILERDFELYSPRYANSGAKNIDELSSKFKEKVVYNLHNKSINWFKLFEHSKVIEILKEILKILNQLGQVMDYTLSIFKKFWVKP